MKRLKNNKGLTLIELLGVVVILGILTTVAIGPISKLITKSNKSYYQSQEDNIVLATQSYLNDNRTLLPLKKGNFTEISLKELIENSYIKTVKDKSGNDCDQTISKITITKKSKNNYEYKVCLKCSNYNSAGC